MLLDDNGHVKLTDFGLAKKGIINSTDQKAYTFVGTLEYLAPEIIEGTGHNKEVDFYSLGALTYEMLSG